MNRLLFCLAVCLLASPVLAGEASDVVRYFYDNPDEAFNAENPRIAEPILSVLKANAANNDEPCIDFSPVLDAQDWDDKELKDSLKLDEKIDGDTAAVTANFKLFGEARSVDWSLAKQADGWKVTDIASKVGEWTLSKFECKASG